MKTNINDTFSPSLYGKKRCLDTIIGTLNPIMWDRRGAAQKFSIYSSNEEDIIIEGFKNRIKLKLLLGKTVEAKGVIQKNEDGEKIIKLSTIREFTGPSSPSSSTSPSKSWGMWSDEYSVCIPSTYKPLHFLEAS